LARPSASNEQDKLRRLNGFLEQDPKNKNIILDSLEAALGANDLEQAATLFARLTAVEATEPRAANLAGLIALRNGRIADAINIFTSVLGSDLGVRLNLAWAHLIAHNHDLALATLDYEELGSDPLALRLRVQALHHLNRLPEALVLGEQATEAGIEDSALFGALSNVALDADKTQLAKIYAMQATDQPDGVATLGMLALGAGDHGAAAAFFHKALSGQPKHARATIGRGLLLLQSDPITAAAELERGAVLFGTHLGSWIAAGA